MKLLIVLLLCLSLSANVKHFTGEVIFINLNDKNLTYMEVQFPIAVGRIDIDTGLTVTPTGRFKVIWKGWCDPGNTNTAYLYGTRFIRLDYKRRGRHLGIHGTGQPELIGKNASAMCIRMKNEHIEQLYDSIQIDDYVLIIGDGYRRESDYGNTE